MEYRPHQSNLLVLSDYMNGRQKQNVDIIYADVGNKSSPA